MFKETTEGQTMSCNPHKWVTSKSVRKGTRKICNVCGIDYSTFSKYFTSEDCDCDQFEGKVHLRVNCSGKIVKSNLENVSFKREIQETRKILDIISGLVLEIYRIKRWQNNEGDSVYSESEKWFDEIMKGINKLYYGNN